MASSACFSGLAQLAPDQFLVRRSGSACSTSQAGCCATTAVERMGRGMPAGTRQSKLRSDMLTGAAGTSFLQIGAFESSVGLFRSAQEQQRVERSQVRCLLRGVVDGFWDGSERGTPGGFAFTGRMPYRSVSEFEERTHEALGLVSLECRCPLLTCDFDSPCKRVLLRIIVALRTGV